MSSTQWEVNLPLDGWTAYAVGLFPFANDRFEVFVKAGAIFWEMHGEAHERVVGGIIPVAPPGIPPGNSQKRISGNKNNGTDIALGLGLNFNSDVGVTIRTEIEYFDVDIMDTVWYLSLSAIYNF